ncbi:flagellar basal-body MS-ring/collar protein FliF [Lysinibacillus piscis]|uniref:Flagellar M-ring protein n=1 Tax=Lysinibacillus piscis TaxID=2518931 RepID=A0ABQ5NGJ4_9BACI|nr:flagellar basal-body MS-ring/collar protein FliF [Lysinibacillus sp. KH24]GLC87404.1 flagellar M-ring protein [Lysinibacillus sp. KH24]
MNERLTKLKNDTSQFWSSRSKTQKILMIGSVVAVIAIAAFITFFVTRTTFVPLYKDLSTREIGQVKEALDSQGVQYEIAPGGTSILVPEEQVDALLVQLASEGYPQTGTIDYSFANSSGFGMTDNEFNLLKKAATETEVAKLIKGLEGVKDAVVRITVPEKSLFVTDVQEEPSASIVLNTDPGYKFTDAQVSTMYNLVAKSIPNLKTENIVISNQFSEYFDLNAVSTNGLSTTTPEGQLQMKKLVERDLQRQMQQMLGTLMGQDKVVVSVTTDIDFKKENREEKLVTPVDPENMAGIEISAQRITEQYSGTGAAATGTPEAERPTDNFTTYNEGVNGDGEYERSESTINNEVNRINKEIQEAPYKIQDMGVQVILEPPTATDAASLPEGVQADVEQIIRTIVRTTISKDVGAELTDEQINDKIAISVQQLYGKATDPVAETPIIPWWVWVIGGILLAVILLLAFFIIRSRRRAKEEEEQSILEQQEELMVDDINEEIETEATMRRKQLEKMAKDKPDDFAKLLRSWIADE